MPRNAFGCWPQLPIAAGDAPYLDDVERNLTRPLAELEANSARSSIKTIRAELELIGIMKQEAQTRVKSASDGIAVAGSESPGKPRS